MKPRKQLNKGDKVKFFGVGYNSHKELISCNDQWWKVDCYYSAENRLSITCFGKCTYLIDRRQVTHVKRKKVRREFYARKCEVSSHDSTLQTQKFHIACVCSSCKIIKVREMK